MIHDFDRMAYEHISMCNDYEPYIGIINNIYRNNSIDPNRKELRSKKYQKKGKKPIIYSKFSPKFGVSNLNKEKIKNCFKWQKIKKKVRTKC